MVQFKVIFLGTTVVDKRFSNPMVQWVMADIQKRRKTQEVNLIIKNGEITGEIEKVVIFRHQIQKIQRFCHDPSHGNTFMYLVKDKVEPVLNVYLFDALEQNEAMKIFQAIREAAQEQSAAAKAQSCTATLTSLCPDISPTNSQFFEVLYVGKMKLSHRKVPDTFIDDAVEKFRLCEVERSRKQLTSQSSASRTNFGGGKATDTSDKATNKNCDNATNKTSRENSTKSDLTESTKQISNSLTDESVAVSGEKSNCIRNNENCDGQENDGDLNGNGTSKTANKPTDGENKFELGCDRTKISSSGMIETFKRRFDDVNQNRTMLFYVGRTDLRLISPDRKQVLLHKMLREINCCIQGIQNNQHFGIVSREIGGYFGYVFKCESNTVAGHVVSAITQTFQAIKEAKDRMKQPVVSCEYCPMMWFHKLCADVEEQDDKKRQLTILKKIETLPEDEQVEIHTKFLGAESSDIKEQNEFLMILLRTHCERKQTRHIHDTDDTRSEVLNQVVPGNTIFMKAKRSLTSSFDHLLKRRGSQAEGFHSKESGNRKLSMSINNSDNHDDHRRTYVTDGPSDGEVMKREISKHMNNGKQFESFCEEGSNAQDTPGPTIIGNTITESLEWLSVKEEEEEIDIDSSKTPLRNIFMKVGSSSQTSSPTEMCMQENMSQTPSGSWRQAIFNRVVTPGKTDDIDGRGPKRKTKEEFRDLWKTAINQQLLLIRMEKENARLRAGQEEAIVKRIKLEYDELSNTGKEQMAIWDDRASFKCDNQALLQAIRQGIPRAKRGDVWYHFAQQYYLKESKQFDSSDFPNYNVPYEDILKQLTSFQHTILIDLGRTFPNHPYFSCSLGPGQLALFNLLKAYSLLDPQVGYCQGLSFVAGVLLLHMSEDQAFLLLRYLMFGRGLRKQYLPDMAALQVQLYQLSRLIHDSLPKLYVHFDKNEIAPTLYATSWMLTLFASQFPLGFVTRVFDLLFVEKTTDILFRVILSLLDEHKVKLLKLSNFEEIMNYLKHEIPKMDAVFVEKLMKKILAMDISKQLHEFEVEYNVLQEEISTPQAELNRLRKVELENIKLSQENISLHEQLEALTKSISQLEKYRLGQRSIITRLDAKVKSLEMSVNILGDFILETKDKFNQIKVPGSVRRILQNLGSVQEELNGPWDTLDNQADKKSFEEMINRSVMNRKKSEGSLRLVAFGGKPQYQSSSNLTSKITFGVNSLFTHPNFNTGRRQSSVPLKSFLHSRESETIKEIPSKEDHTGLVLAEDSAIHSFIHSIHSIHSKENRPKELEEQSSGKSNVPSVTRDEILNANETKNNVNPLESSKDVNITFNGTTELKSPKPDDQSTSNRVIDLLPVKNEILHISEDTDV